MNLTRVLVIIVAIIVAVSNIAIFYYGTGSVVRLIVLTIIEIMAIGINIALNVGYWRKKYQRKRVDD